MSSCSHDLARRYDRALREYLAGAGERALHEAYELGREAVRLGVPLLDLASAHHEALGALFRNAPASDGARMALTVKQAGEFLAESLSPYEMTNRGFQEANATLRRLNEALAAANRELEAFSYSVSHDLRAPLRAIDGFTQAIMEDCADKIDGETKDYFDRIRAACSRMSEILDGLLTLSRITRAELRIEPVDLSAMAREIASELRRTNPDRRVEFAIADGLRARGDVRLLRVVMENLLGNAWKYTRHHASARIEFGAIRQGGEDVYFVKDDGAGFDMAYAERLFEPFQRLHRQTDFEGLGIGLATVHRIVRRHNGRIWAEGAVEQGAVFYFTLNPGGRYHGSEDHPLGGGQPG